MDADTKAVWLDEGDIEQHAHSNTVEDQVKIREILAKAREMHGLDLDDVASLLAIRSPMLREELFDTARAVKEESYGKRIVLFAPLYFSNLCSNECLYCAFRRSNREVTRKALSMEPYALTEISFTADLSTPGKEYGLVVYTTMDGDEDPANDTCTKTVRCAPDADPYVMDFEGCLDFSIDGFNPRWKTLDLDKGYTWTVTDVSFPGMGEAMAFMAFNPSATNPSMIEYNMTAFQGEKFGACFGNASEEVMPPLTNNDWLISPKMKMAQDAKLSFFVRKYDPTLVEEYYVLVSADSDDPEDFHRVGGLREASAEWERVEVDLSEYANKEIYIAINCVSYDGYVFMIDDIRVSKPSANEGSALSAQLSLYPNPASEIISIQSTDARIQSVVLYDLSGRETFQSGNNLSTNLFRYNVSGLVPGIYFAKVQTTQGTEILKFVVR